MSMNKESDQIELLKKIKSLFEKNNIEFWLDTGTLLGAVREKRFIPWDTDLDLGTWAYNLPRIKKIFEENKHDEFEIAYFDLEKNIDILHKEYKVDINLYELKNNKAVRTWYVNNKIGSLLDYFRWIFIVDNISFKKSSAPRTITVGLSKIRKMIPKRLTHFVNKVIGLIYLKIGCIKVDIAIPKKYFEKLVDMDFLGTKFKVPEETEEYLELRYGKNWRTPNKNYVYYKDDGAIIRKKQKSTH